MTMSGELAAGVRGRPGWLPKRVGWRDAVAIAAYLLAVAGGARLSVPDPVPSPLWPLPVLALLGVAVLLLRETRPTTALIAATVLMVASIAVGSAAEVFLVLVMLFETGARRAPRAAWLSFAAVAVVTALVAGPLLANRLVRGPALWGTSLRRGTSIADFLLNTGNFTAIVVPLALIATLLGLNVGHRRRFVAARAERAAQARRELAAQVRADERERISREMHDVIAHSIAVMIALSDGAQAAAARRPEAAQDAMRRVSETGRRTLGEVRRLLGSVSDPEAAQPETPGSPSIAELPALVDEFRAAGLPVRLDVGGEHPDDPVLGFTVYRIVQESLTNVLRHATGVRDVHVDVALSAAGADVVVEDRSDPVAGVADLGRGLLGIRERAAFYDGEVEAGPRAIGGWRVSARLAAVPALRTAGFALGGQGGNR